MKPSKYLLLFSLLFAAALPAHATIETFNFQGRLVDSNGIPITDSKSVVFTLWGAATGGSSVFTETQTVTPDENGVYSVLLGSVNQTLGAIDFSDDMWLQVEVDGQVIAPRYPLSSAPSALSVRWDKIVDIPSSVTTLPGLLNPLGIRVNGGSVHADVSFINFTNRFKVAVSADPDGVDVDIDTTSFTMQGNTFNGPGQLVQLLAGPQLPPVDATQLTLVGASTLTVQGSAMSVGLSTFVVTNGMVGIGTPTPSAKLHISSGGFIMDGADPFVTIGDDTFVITNRRIGIGTVSPDFALSVNGDASKAGGGTWQTFSDARLKDVVGPFTYGLKEVLQLNPVRYRYKTGNPLKLPSDKENVGFIAQDVQKVMPEAVRETSNGYLTLGSDPILWSMLNAIKELSAEHDALAARVEQLEKSAK